MSNSVSGGVSPGWYPEPGTGFLRWWDGQAWGGYHPQPPLQQQNALAPVTAPRINGFAVAALVLGIWGFIATWTLLLFNILLGSVPDLLAIVFGILGLVRARRTGRGTGLATAGLVLGSLSLLSMLFGTWAIW